MIESYYINLTAREDRKELMEKNWCELVSLNRLSATHFPEDNFGTRGCFESHKNALQLISMGGGSELSIICEDDIIPSDSFKNRLEILLSELPKDWSVLMLGYSATERSDFHLVSNNMCKANSHVLSGTCYIVNPSFYGRMLSEYSNEIHQNNLDSLIMVLQEKYNFYMAMPSLCYQYKSYSDNSKMILENTEFTKTFFRD